MACFLALLLLIPHYAAYSSLADLSKNESSSDLRSTDPAFNEIPHSVLMSSPAATSSEVVQVVKREEHWWKTFQEKAVDEMRKIDRSLSSIVRHIRDKMKAMVNATNDSSPSSLTNATREFVAGEGKVIQGSFGTAQDLAFKIPAMAKDGLSQVVQMVAENVTWNASVPEQNLTKVLLEASGGEVYAGVKNKTLESFQLTNEIAMDASKIAKGVVVKAKEAVNATKVPRIWRAFPFFRIFRNTIY